LAIPIIELADNCNDVPLIVTLKRLGAPLSVAVPVKVAVPADADKLPLTTRPDDMEKLASVVMEPVAESVAKIIVPAPDIVFEVPLMVTAPLLVKLPLTDKLPVSTKGVALLTEPFTVRLSREIPEPLIVFVVPDIIKLPPEAWLNEPAPVVDRLPVRLILPEEKLTAEAATVRLLKF
jgi:hypothetical protein